MAGLRTDVRVSALMRQVNDAGGLGVVLVKGDASAGGVLAIVSERNGPATMLERGIGPSGSPELIKSGPVDADESAVTAYWQRRRGQDPDLWIVALDVPNAERFVAVTILDV